jgi:hypothetical protein
MAVQSAENHVRPGRCLPHCILVPSAYSLQFLPDRGRLSLLRSRYLVDLPVKTFFVNVSKNYICRWVP